MLSIWNMCISTAVRGLALASSQPILPQASTLTESRAVELMAMARSKLSFSSIRTIQIEASYEN